MADNESLKSQKEEEREVEKLLHKQQKCLHSIAVPSRSSVEVEFREESSQSETLAVILSNPASENDHGSNCCYFSELLSGAMASPVSNSMELLSDGLDLKRAIPTGSVDPTGFPMVSSPPLLDPDGFKGRFGMSNQEVLASESTEAQAQEQLQAGYASSPSELSLNSLTQSMSSALSATPLQQRLSPVPKDNSVCIPEVNQQNSSDQKSKAARVIVKTPSTDEYNWRKYGQKQVKSTQSSRSYYKCTNSDCHAKKKVEHSDHSGRVTEIIYKGQHNHCPPRKIKCTRARRLVSSAGPIIGSKTIDCPVQKLNDSDPSMHRRELTQETLPTPELKRQSSSGSDGNVGNRAEEEHGDEPEPKRRMKESSVAYLLPPFKTVKEPKIVVQAAGDVGISGDGYRWRKYGQKMVKGNPHPRSYYKCTSAGCPVRKHVERATDDTTAIIITYEGKHDHDMPVPKKRHGQPSAALLIAAAAAMNNAQFKKIEALPNQRSSTQWQMDMEGELAGERALELGGEKALESARTLLSIGIELKPY